MSVANPRSGPSLPESQRRLPTASTRQRKACESAGHRQRLGAGIGYAAAVDGAGNGAAVIHIDLPVLAEVEYLPTGNRNLVFAIVLPPPGYNVEELGKLGQIVEDELAYLWDVDPDSPEVKKLKYPAIADFFYVARGRQVFIGLRAHDANRAAELVPALMELGPKLPGSFLVASQASLFARGLTAGRTIDIEITGRIWKNSWVTAA